MRIFAPDDGGNIEVVASEDPSHISLAIRPDRDAPEFMQWFHFSVEGARGVPLHFKIINAGECTYPDAWEGYDVCASHDLTHWFRVRAQFDDETLSFHHTPKNDLIHFAYFAPYEVTRHEALLAR